MMAAHAKDRDLKNGSITTTGVDTYAFTSGLGYTSYPTTSFFCVLKIGATNTAYAPTLNMDGLGAKPIVDQLGGSLIPGDLLINTTPVFLWNGTNFVMIASVVGWQTGDVKATYKTTADVGWVMMDDGTIGDATSGATTRANADTSALFVLLWTNTADTDCPVSSGRGGSAAADFAAHKTIALPKTKGRAVARSGAGSGLTSRALGSKIGDENLQAHTHVYTSVAFATNYAVGVDVQAPYAQVSGTTGSTGAGSGGNMQPSTFLNLMIKL